MWAYQLHGPLCLLRREIDRPRQEALADGEVLLRFLAGGVCGSDIARCRDGFGGEGPQPYGLSLHEIVGQVVASRSDLAAGTRVVGWVGNSRGLCEYVVTPACQLLPVGPPLDDVHAVALQPLACVLYAVGQLREIHDARVAVIGLGPIGLLFAHALRSAGARSVDGVDVVARTELAGRFGLDDVERNTSRTWSRARGHADAYDLVVEAVGHQVGTLDDAIAVAAPGGTVVCFGNPDDAYYPVRFAALMDKNLTLRAGRTPVAARRRALELAAAYVTERPGLLDTFVTHVVPVSDAQRAYRLAGHPDKGQLKVVLDGAR